MRPPDEHYCGELYIAVIKQAVDDWKSCVKNRWKGKREMYINCGGFVQNRYTLSKWIKEYAPQSRAIFRFAMQEANEEMLREYRVAYEDSKRIGDEFSKEKYTKIRKYPYFRTKGIQLKINEIIESVNEQIEEERNGEPI